MSSAPTTNGTAATPTDFFCEHAADTSRLLVMLHRAGHSPAAHAVLSYPDAGVTEAAAGMLRRAAEYGLTPHLRAKVDRLTTSLPDGPAVRLGEAVAWASARSWPAPAHAHQPLPERHDEDDEEDDDEEDDDEEGEGAADTDTASRLAELSGRVVRVVRLIEIHLPDPQRFLAAMAEDGWEPLPADQLSDDDPQDLVGAVMSATDDLPPTPGARPVTQTSQAHLLDPALA